MNILLITSLLLSAFLIAPESFSQTISRDGNYVMASVSKTLDGSDATLVIQSTTGTWKREIPTSDQGTFTLEGKQAIYLAAGRLYILRLGSDQEVSLRGVVSYQQPISGRGAWIAYQREGVDRVLVLRNLGTGMEREFRSVTSYFFAGDRALIVSTTVRRESTSDNALLWVDLPTGEDRTIWSDQSAVADGLMYDAPTEQLAFLVQVNGSAGKLAAIWHFKAGSEKARPLIEDGMPGIDAGLLVADDPFRFSHKGGKIFFKLREKDLPKPDPKLINIDVWSYLDPKEQSVQIKDLFPRHYAAAVSIATRQVVRLEYDNEVLAGTGEFDSGGEETDDFALIAHFNGDVFTYIRNGEGADQYQPLSYYSLGEYNWNKATISKVYLVSTDDGSRTLLKSDIKPASASFPYFRFSPEGRYVIYYDPAQNEYLSYEIADGVTRHLTRGVATRWTTPDPEKAPGLFYLTRGILGWIEGDVALLLQDHYGDIWRVDPSGQRSSVNVTHSFARQHHLDLVWEHEYEQHDQRQRVLKSQETIVLKAQTGPNAIRHMHGGYYVKNLDASGDPQALVKIGGAYDYAGLERAADAPVYVVARQNAKEPQSAYYTRDFRGFTHITSSQPERRRAVEQELVAWKTFDGTQSQGVLLKPVDFDSLKKYPIIFYYYEKFERLIGSYDKFHPAGMGEFVDDGYLVFVPDIHYTIGHTGQSVYNSVVSAARTLAKRPYVDAKHMGLVGASFSGFETNYLVTHTNAFAAAWSGCGVSDFFSYYGTEEKDEQGRGYASSVEHGQERLGATPWERPDLYIENSPVFNAEKVTTPLVLWHNDHDYRVPFSQSVEFFKALRRLGKRVWLLNLEGGTHCGASLSLEFGSAYKQFFDHYLEGAPAPKWMTRGVPARIKGIDDGMELDKEIKTPPPGGLLMEEEAKTPQQQQLLKKHNRTSP